MDTSPEFDRHFEWRDPSDDPNDEQFELVGVLARTDTPLGGERDD